MKPASPTYLLPYQSAARRHGGNFRSLLWASERTQGIRFEALCRLYRFAGQNVLDAGCGRADLLDFLLKRGHPPAHYTGIEAVDELAEAARAKHHPDCTIVQADFVRQPIRLLVGADVIVFSGSLNTMEEDAFLRTVHRAFEATAQAVLLNFLSSPQLASAAYLRWRQPQRVLSFARELGATIYMLDDYLPGDCTIALWRQE